jgi:hypothetical protein
MGGTGAKSASRLNFRIAEYDLDAIAAWAFPLPSNGGSKGDGGRRGGSGGGKAAA